MSGGFCTIERALELLRPVAHFLGVFVSDCSKLQGAGNIFCCNSELGITRPRKIFHSHHVFTSLKLSAIDQIITAIPHYTKQPIFIPYKNLKKSLKCRTAAALHTVTNNTIFLLFCIVQFSTRTNTQFYYSTEKDSLAHPMCPK